MAVEGWMRAANVDREETVEILRQAFAEGRLDPAELDERADAAFRARTVGDLRGLIADLPRGGSPACLTSDRPPRPREPCRPWRAAGQSPRVGLLMVLAAAVCVVVAAVLQSTAPLALALTAGLASAVLRRR